MDATKARKILKVLCIVCMVVYGLFAALGIAITAGVIPLEAVVDGMGVSGLLDSPDATLYSSITVTAANARSSTTDAPNPQESNRGPTGGHIPPVGPCRSALSATFLRAAL